MEKTKVKALVKKAKKGNADAFGELYSQYASELYRFALWYLHSEEDACDAVQDACLKAYSQLRYLKKEEAFKSWFFKILANVCRDMLAVSQSSSACVALDDSRLSYEPPDPHSQSFVVSAELSELLELLSPTDRAIVLLSAVGGFTGREIGSMLKMNGSTVRSRLSRSLARLREQLT